MWSGMRIIRNFLVQTDSPSVVRDPQFADTPWSGKGEEVSVSSNFKRKRRTKAQKEDIGQKFESGKRTCSELAGQYRISPILIYKWRRAMQKAKKQTPAIEVF